MLITYVTGASGSGKTTFHDRLTARGVLAHVTELDDHDPRPHAAHVEWLNWRAAEHLREATEMAMTEEDIRSRSPGHRVVTGIVWPFSLVQSTAWRSAMEAGVEVGFVLLDRPWADIAATLTERLSGWPKEDRDEQIENNRRLQRLLRLQCTELTTGMVVRDGDLGLAESIVLRGEDLPKR